MPPRGYVAIITDGNGRWAQERGLPVVEGHRAGADTVKARLQDAVELGIEELTVFSFSTENWSRPAEEVDGLMAMFGERIDRETPELDEEGVRMRFVGRREGVAPELVERWTGPKRRPPATTRITLFVAFNYGGRAEIVDAARSFEGGGEEEFRRHLYAPEMHDPDLLIRTSGEQRISNYLLWQCAYSELVFRDELWPDFSREALEESPARVRGAPAAFRSEDLMQDLFDDEIVRRRSRRAEADAPRPPRKRRHGGAQRGETRRSGSSSRSPGSSSRSRSSSPAASSSPLAMIGIGVLCLREFLAMTERLRPIAACRLHRRRRR